MNLREKLGMQNECIGKSRSTMTARQGLLEKMRKSLGSRFIGKPEIQAGAAAEAVRRPSPPIRAMARADPVSPADAAAQDSNQENRNIMIYWDDSTPPPSISAVLEKWESICPDWNVSLYNSETASRFLHDKFGMEILRLFSQCALPTMKSDFFRVFWAASEGGVYSDVTFSPVREPLFFDEKKNITLLKDDNMRIRNGIFFAKKNCAQIKLIAFKIIKNVSIKNEKNMYMVTGPGAWVEAIGKEETDSIAIRNFWEVRRKFTSNSIFPESTRNTENHWSKVQERQSIFCEPNIEEK